MPNAEPISDDRALRWLLAYLLAAGVLYGALSHWPRIAPLVIAASALDAAIPALSSSVPLYLSYVLLMPALVYFGRRQAWLLPAFFAGALATGLCLVSHLLWPTMVVRPEPAATATLLRWLYAIDAPVAASPCGHVALPLALALTLAGLRVRWATLYAAWTIVLGVVVLTSKQHVLIDLLWGAAVGAFSAALTLALRRAAVDLRTLAALLLEWLVLVVVLVAALTWRNPWGYALAFVVIATRQHALFILYHDATHGLWCRRSLLNDVLVNALVGVPQVLPIEVYRPLHLEHHRTLGTAEDPERLYLYRQQPWAYRPLPVRALIAQWLGDLLLLNSLRTVVAYLRTRGAAALKPSLALGLAALPWIAIVAVLLHALDATTLEVLALLWFGPLLTLAYFLQKIRSFAEHSGGPGVTPDWNDWTYSWRVGWIGRLGVWPYHINLHREHHRRASVPWHGLPGLVDPEQPVLDGAAIGRLMLK